MHRVTVKVYALTNISVMSGVQYLNRIRQEKTFVNSLRAGAYAELPFVLETGW
jgi:hypothetical protein